MGARFEYLGSAKTEDVKALIEERDELVTKIGDLRAVLRYKKNPDNYDVKLHSDMRTYLARLEVVIVELNEHFKINDKFCDSNESINNFELHIEHYLIKRKS